MFLDMGPFLYYEDGRLSIKRDKGPMPQSFLPLNAIRALGYGGALMFVLALGNAFGLSVFLAFAGISAAVIAIIEAIVRDHLNR